MIERESPFAIGTPLRCLLLSENADHMVQIAEKRFTWAAETVRKAAYGTGGWDGLDFGRDAELFLGTLNNSLIDGVGGYRLAPNDTRLLVVDGEYVGIIGQGQAIPVFGNVRTFTLSQIKTGAIRVLARESFENGNSETESFLNRGLAEDVVGSTNKAFIEKALLTDSNSTVVSSLGDTPSLIMQTLNAAVAAMDLKPTSSLNLVVETPTLASLATKTDASGQAAFPGLHASKGGEITNGIRVIPVDRNQLPDEDSDGKFCVIYDADAFLLNRGQLYLSKTDRSQLELADDPTMDALGPTAATRPAVSLFQAEAVALKTVRSFSLQSIRNAVVSIGGVSW